jgi:hypothetical protein
MRDSSFSISITIDPASGFRTALARCRAAREGLRQFCHGSKVKLAVSSTWRNGTPAIVFRAAD